MPAKPSWYVRVPLIVAELRAFESPLMDRDTVERVFALSRRAALYLMARLPSFQIGRTSLVHTADVIAFVEAVRVGEDFDYEKRRHVRLWEQLETIRRERSARQVAITEPRDSRADSLLPEGVRLGRGLLEISFSGTEDLLSKLYGLSQSVARDYEGFDAAVQQSRKD